MNKLLTISIMISLLLHSAILFSAVSPSHGSVSQNLGTITSMNLITIKTTPQAEQTQNNVAPIEKLQKNDVINLEEKIAKRPEKVIKPEKSEIKNTQTNEDTDKFEDIFKTDESSSEFSDINMTNITGTSGGTSNEPLQAESFGANELYFPKPGYPAIARKRGFEGKVKLEIYIGIDGLVRDAHILESSGYNMLDKAAMDVLKDVRYMPAKYKKMDHELIIHKTIIFELKKYNL